MTLCLRPRPPEFVSPAEVHAERLESRAGMVDRLDRGPSRPQLMFDRESRSCSFSLNNAFFATGSPNSVAVATTIGPNDVGFSIGPCVMTLRNGVRTLASLYDMQHDPASRDDMTYVSPSTGEQVGRGTHTGVAQPVTSLAQRL